MAQSDFNRRRGNPRGEPTRTLTLSQIKQIEASFEELEQKAAQWESKARQWEAAAAEAQTSAAEWETRARELQTVATNAQAQAIEVEARADRWASEAEDAKKKLANLEAEAGQWEQTVTELQTAVSEKEQVLRAAEEKASKAENRLARDQADYQNRKQRLERRVADQADQEKMQLMHGLLPVLDNLDRAIANAPPMDAEHRVFQEGVELTRRSFLSILARFGVHPIDAAENPFDPELHEAVGTVNDPAFPPGTVVNVEQAGYTYQDKLLQPARVLITPI
jgi:molecular chaperone GrpE